MVDIIVAFPKTEDAKAIKNILIKNGYNVIATAFTGAKAIQQANSLEEGILICSYAFPDMMYTEIRENLDFGIHMLLITGANKVIDGISENVIFLPTPLKVHALVSSVDMLAESILRSRKRKKKFIKQKNNQDFELIKKAKDLLMERNNMTEEQAHRYLQKTSMNSGNSMLDTALMIISLKE